MKVVFDTNIFISAFATEGICSVLLKRARLKEFELFVCPIIIKEIENVLKQKFKIKKEIIEEVVALIKEASTYSDAKEKIEGICRDKDDDLILSCAISAKANYIVSGDKDLLEIKQYKDIKIISPRDFEAML